MAAVVLSPDNSIEAIKRSLMAGLVPYLRGSPGVGKSQIVHAVAEYFNLYLIDYRLAQADPTDLQGFPENDNHRMCYAPPKDIPIEGDKIPDGFAGWMLFFDELSQAFPSVQNASYKIFLDKKVGQKKIHPKCVMVAAGNLDTDKANTHRMSTALQSRITHLQMSVSNNDWQKWAVDNGIDHRIRGFLKWKPKLLHNFAANQAADIKEDTFACPRTWEFASRALIQRPNELDVIDLAILTGNVGSGPAIEFQGFAAIYDKLPQYAEIHANPTGAPIPTEPSVLHALASLLAHPQHLDTITDIVPYIERMPVEFQVWSLRDAIRLKNSLLHHPALEDWKDKYADRLY